MSGKVITIRDPEVTLIRDIKLLTGRGTASQAFIAAAELAIRQHERIDDMRDEIRRLTETVAVYKQTLLEAHTAAVRLAEVAGQGDLLLPSDNPLRPGYRPPSRLKHHLER